MECDCALNSDALTAAKHNMHLEFVAELMARDIQFKYCAKAAVDIPAHALNDRTHLDRWYLDLSDIKVSISIDILGINIPGIGQDMNELVTEEVLSMVVANDNILLDDEGCPILIVETLCAGEIIEAVQELQSVLDSMINEAKIMVFVKMQVASVNESAEV